MKKESIICEDENLYFIEGYDEKYYVIRIESVGGMEVNIHKDTFEVIKASARFSISLEEAYNRIAETAREEKVIWKEIAVLLERGVITIK